MISASTERFARWRALARLLRPAGRVRLAGFALLVLGVGLLPTGLILLTGVLIAGIPGVIEHGLGSPEGRPATLALAALVLASAALAAGSAALTYLSRALDHALGLTVHGTVAALTLGTPRLAPLEDPVVRDELHAVQEAERRGVLRTTMSAFSNVAITRLRGAGAFVVLLGFSWWAPLLLAGAWHLTNRLYLRATENGVSFDLSDGAVRLRRAEYVRSLAMEPPAAKELRVFGLGSWVVNRYGDAWMDALRMMWQSRSASRGLAMATVATLAISHGIVFGALGLAASTGEIEVALLIVFVQAAIATSHLGMIGDWQWLLGQALAVLERVDRLSRRAETEPPPVEHVIAAIGDGGPALRLDGVRFTYRGREEPTLAGLSLEVPEGQSLAIVGENGAGKSTLIKLLCGLYEPDSGTVTLQGGLPPLQARGQIAAIFQDFVRYPLPLRENVGFGSLPLMEDEEALDGALRDAGAADLPSRLPKGWDTILSREYAGGADLSGGQWQRVALARALAAVRGGARLLILDEPTAALDVRAETELFERFLEVTRGVTTVLVSHRLSSVRRADRIVVVQDGRVAEDGTHDELMQAGGLYARMYSLQAERFAAADAAPEGLEEVLDA